MALLPGDQNGSARRFNVAVEKKYGGTRKIEKGMDEALIKNI